MLSINAVKFEFGSGFDGSQMKGSEHNDLFNANGSTRTNLQEAYKAELAMVWIFISELQARGHNYAKQESLDNTGAITEMTGKGAS
jgi:chorismate synthase